MKRNLTLRNGDKMNDIRELGKLMKAHPVMIVVTLAAMVVGAVFGAIAYYQGWLG